MAESVPVHPIDHLWRDRRSWRDGKVMLRTRPPRVKHVVEGSFNRNETLVLSVTSASACPRNPAACVRPGTMCRKHYKNASRHLGPDLIGAAHELNFAA
jgi:hypothetical protein